MVLLPRDFNVFAYKQLASCFLLEANLETLHRSEMDVATSAMLKVQNGVHQLLMGKISPAEFLELVDSCEMVGIDDYLDAVEDNLEEIGILR